MDGKVELDTIVVTGEVVGMVVLQVVPATGVVCSTCKNTELLAEITELEALTVVAAAGTTICPAAAAPKAAGDELDEPIAVVAYWVADKIPFIVSLPVLVEFPVATDEPLLVMPFATNAPVELTENAEPEYPVVELLPALSPL